MTRILIVGLGDGTPTAFDGKYLLEYDPTRPGVDPEGHALIAHIVATEDIDQAQGFETAEDAFETWRRAAGIREDGQLNRPLTAFTVEFV